MVLLGTVPGVHRELPQHLAHGQDHRLGPDQIAILYVVEVLGLECRHELSEVVFAHISFGNIMPLANHPVDKHQETVE